MARTPRVRRPAAAAAAAAAVALLTACSTRDATPGRPVPGVAPSTPAAAASSPATASGPATASPTATGPYRVPSAVYTGACTTAATAAFAAWSGISGQLAVDGLDQERYANLAAPTYWTGCWGARTMVYSVPLLEAEGGTLAEGAAGVHDAAFAGMGRTLVAAGEGDAWLRLGWEFNSSAYPWAAKASPATFAAYYRRVVTVLRAVPGEHFRFIWNPELSERDFPAAQAWPGADVVDSIGIDLYDGDGTPGTYPWPAHASAAVVAQHRAATWRDLESGPQGLDYWAGFAAAHGVPLSMPEWGLVAADHGGGGDDPAFVRHVSAWVQAHDLQFDAYFDVADGPLGDERLGPPGSSAFPAASLAYRALFGG